MLQCGVTSRAYGLRSTSVAHSLQDGPPVIRDLRFGLRVLARNPAFAAAAIGVMSLGIGATTAVFSIVRAVLLEALPYREPDRLVLFRADAPGYTREPALTGDEVMALRERADLFDSVAAIYESEGNLTAPDAMEAVTAASATPDFLETLGAGPLLGRAPQTIDMGERWVNGVAVSYDVWQRRFRGDPRAIGKPIEINNIPMTVVGVMPRGFRLDLGPGVTVAPYVDVWFPMGSLTAGGMGTYRDYTAIARLKRGVSVAAAQSAVDAMMTAFAAAHPGSYRAGATRLTLARLDRDVVSAVKPALVALAGAVAFVLLVACANLTNLLLARASARSRELAIRASIGASRAQIVRQLVAEGLILGTLGAAGGLLFAQWAVDVLLTLAPALPRREAIAIDGGAAAFAAAVSLLTAIVVSLVPAWHATKADVTAMMKEDPTASRRAGLTRGLLIASQLALSLVLLVGAGLMTRAFISLRSAPLGFDPRNAVTMNVHLQVQRFNVGNPDDARTRRREFYRELADAVSRMPGVERVGIGLPVPLAGPVILQRLSTGPADRERQADAIVALAGYLESLRVPLVAGRTFERADDERPAVILEERLAAELFGGQSPQGRRVLLSPTGRSPQWAEVIGVVPHVQMRDVRGGGLPQIWMSYASMPYSDLNIVVRGESPMTFVSGIQRAVADLKPGRPVHDIALMEDYVTRATADTRFALFVLAVFALLAVTLTAVGVYGIVAYATARRTREIAVRLALGADARRIVTLVLHDGLVWTAVGLAAGAIAARLLTRYLETLLFRVGPNDPLTFAAVAAALSAIAILASAVPAIRAVRIDPMLSLRAE